MGYVTSAIIALVAIPVGNDLAARANQERFRQIVTIILFCGGLMLATTGTGLVSSFLLAGLSVAGICVLGLYWTCSSTASTADASGIAVETPSASTLVSPEVVGQVAALAHRKTAV